MKLEEIDLGYSTIFGENYPLVRYPYCIAFVYSKCGRNCIVKGDYTLVRDYVKNNFSYALVNFTMWKDGRSRNIWRFFSDEKVYLYYFKSPATSGKKKYVLRIISRSTYLTLKTLTFRRMPNRWIKDFDIVC